MDTDFKGSIWQQFGAAIDTLADAINLCPDGLWTGSLWDDPEGEVYGQFWALAYHTVFWLDLYLFGASEGFAPPPPFKRGALPETPYTKDQVRTYLHQCRQKCQSIIEGLTDETAHRLCAFNWIKASYLEMQLYSMRHVQEHAAQLSMFLGSQGVTGMDWIPQARIDPAS